MQETMLPLILRYVQSLTDVGASSDGLFYYDDTSHITRLRSDGTPVVTHFSGESATKTRVDREGEDTRGYLMTALTKTYVERESTDTSDDTSALVQTLTTTKESRETEDSDQDRFSMQMMTKTEVERESEDERQYWLC